MGGNVATHHDPSRDFEPWALEKLRVCWGQLTWKQASLFWDLGVPEGGRARRAGPREGQARLAEFGRRRGSWVRGRGICRLRLSDWVTKGPSVRGAEEAKAVELSELTAPVVGQPGLGTFLHVAQVTRGREGFCQQGVRPGSLVLQHSQPACSSQPHTSLPSGRT